VPIVLKSGSLNLLEPSGPVQTCNGIALPLTRTFEKKQILVISRYVNTPESGVSEQTEETFSIRIADLLARFITGI
jgi:hypothetical protein